LHLILHSQENDGVTGGSRGAQRTGVREHVRPSATRAEEVVVNAPGENFPVALRVLPARHRRHLTNLYFFARLTDDLGDEVRGYGGTDSPPQGASRGMGLSQGASGGMGPPGRKRKSGGVTGAVAPPGEIGDRPPETTQLRLRLLDELAADVDRIYRGEPAQSPVMRAMGETVRECGVPARPLLDLIQANRQDQLVTRYASYAELAKYCELSANPVGQIVLYIFGVATPERIMLSDSICTALQLAEHWQDVAEDLGQGRIYLPAEDMARYGCTEADLARPTAGPAVRELMRFEVRRAAELLDHGAPLLGTLRGAARLAVAGYVAGGRAALAAIRAQRYDVLARTARPRKRRLAGELAVAYVRGR
jgi:squalene synthase HpnC